MVCLNGNKMYYVDQGKGRPLLFVHGLGGDHHLFAPQITAFSQTHRVIAPHNRGNGRSGHLEGRPGRVLDEQCRDLAALIRYLKLERVVLCGTSYGGVLGFHFILSYPELVAGMVIADGFSDTRIAGFAEALLVPLHYLSLWSSYLPGGWMIPFLKLWYRKWPIAQAYALYAARTLRKHDFALQRLAIHSLEDTDRLQKVRCPVLGIVGDTFPVSVRAMKRSMGAIPGGRLKIVSNSLDPTNLCQIRTYNTLLRSFLREIDWG